MLPDFLKTKEKLKKKHNTEMKKAQFRHLGPFADTPKSEIFEGDEVILIRADGSREEVEMKEAEGKMEIKLKEIEEMTHERILDKIDTVAREMAKQIAKSGYEVIDKAAQEVGNVTSADGEPQRLTNLSNRIVSPQCLNQFSLLHQGQLNHVEAFFWISSANVNRPTSCSRCAIRSAVSLECLSVKTNRDATFSTTCCFPFVN